jgi:hypothetical protein
MALLAIGLMYASFIAIGWLVHAARRRRLAAAGGSLGAAADDFMVAGRAMPLWLATFTMTATWASTDRAWRAACRAGCASASA